MIAKNRIAAIIICLLAACIGCGISATAQAQSREYAVKAAFLYNFAKFVEWPAASAEPPSAPITICIVGHDPYGPLLENIRNKEVRSRPIDIQRMEKDQPAANCKIVFISQSEKSRLPQILSRLEGQPILTVSDIDGFAESGGMINFVTVKNKIRFKINTGACNQVNLKISANLLKLATIVETTGKGSD